MIITVFVRARHTTSFWATWIQSTSTHSIPFRSILILSSHLRHDFSSGLFPSVFPIKTIYMHFSSIQCLLISHPSHLLEKSSYCLDFRHTAFSSLLLFLIRSIYCPWHPVPQHSHSMKNIDVPCARYIYAFPWVWLCTLNDFQHDCHMNCVSTASIYHAVWNREHSNSRADYRA